LLYIAVKKLRKAVNICQSYHKNKRVSFFMVHSVELRRTSNVTLPHGWCSSDPDLGLSGNEQTNEPLPVPLARNTWPAAVQ